MLPTVAALVVTNTVLTGGWDAITVPNCKSFSLKVRGANSFKLSHQVAGTAYITIQAGGSFDSPLGDFAAQTLYMFGTAADVAELVYVN